MKNKISRKYKKKSPLWFWLLSLGAILAGVLIGILILFGYSPAAYQPKTPENPEQVSLYLTHQLGPEFINQVQLDSPFELIVEQSGLNDIISRWDWPEQFGDVSLIDPIVFFVDQSIIFMGKLQYKEVSSVVSMTTFPEMNDDGQICMNIESIRMGMLPVTALVSKLAQTTFQANLDCFEGEPEAKAITEAMIKNEFFDPVFWFMDRRVRISKFTIETGLIKITLTPEDIQQH